MFLQGQLLNVDKNGGQKRSGKEQKNKTQQKTGSAILRSRIDLQILQPALAVGKGGSALKFFEHLYKIARVHIPKLGRDIRNAFA